MERLLLPFFHLMKLFVEKLLSNIVFQDMTSSFPSKLLEIKHFFTHLFYKHILVPSSVVSDGNRMIYKTDTNSCFHGHHALELNLVR